MYNNYNRYPCPYNPSMYNSHNMYNPYRMYPYPYWGMYNPNFNKQFIELKDYGPEPFVVNIDEATKQNNNFRIALWTGENLQVTLMSIEVDEDIGLEVHPDGDQFIRIEEGQGIVKMGDSKNKLDFQERVFDDYAIMIPAGKWHNIINTGNKPLKLYAIYAPPEHPRDTIHETKEDAEADERSYRY
ncbi:cupin domain-containing protein [Caldisalinibacter kiritimatiensis]|uniref:Mannose-6-phosphate isomerase n=1 Tax=Caldisalinibacter kiritimatiensis TaxID=1304284 RepID=R1AVK0_9FIRM|nr:cupin domain-containing protein [Caldisalinibacter kiritimatiensis]EOD01228.1 Mannose-6-phosphate isomerase [Caldisalinibacter kiritimatiensis]